MTSKLLTTLFTSALACFCAGPALSQGRSDVDRLEELEYWKAASSINTVQAYEGYVNRYKDGTFAVLAQAAIAKLRTSEGQAPTSAERFAGFKMLDEQSPSTLLPYAIGTRLVGPGVIQVGDFGTNIQVLLPPGSWVFLGAQDYSVTYTASVSMTSAAFGEVSNGVVVSILLVDLTRGAVPTSAAGWNGLSRCQAQSDSPEITVSPNHRRAQACGRLLREAAPAGGTSTERKILELASNNLRRIGGKLSPFNSRIEVSALSSRNRYIEYTKLECAPRFDKSSSCADAGRFALGAAEAGEGAVSFRHKWLVDFALLAADGVLYDLDTTDITPKRVLPAQTN
jgi:hypothetical protein